MKIATILYSYVRNEHTEKVLSALKENTVLPEKLFVFQDGLKNSKDKEAWEKTNALINNISWCDCEVIVSEINKGLKNSIVSGLEYVFREYDAVVVLEDDCVPHPLFMSYMNQALNYYNDFKKVYCVTGFAHSFDVEANGTDVYFAKRICTWGWGTWKEKWSIYEEDYTILGRMLNNPQLSQRLRVWGEDLESHLLGNVYGYCNTWDVFWTLKVLENDGYCVYPYKSMIENIGFDGSGEHCGNEERELQGMLKEKQKKEFIFYDKLSISEKTKENFSQYLAWKSGEKRIECYYNVLLQWMQLHMKGKTVNDFLKAHGINKMCIWGKGKVCDLLLQELNEQVEVLAIVESKPAESTYKDISIISAQDIPDEADAVIIIPEYDYEKILWKLDDRYHSKLYKISDIVS